jgi:hypothetical protein
MEHNDKPMSTANGTSSSTKKAPKKAPAKPAAKKTPAAKAADSKPKMTGKRWTAEEDDRLIGSMIDQVPLEKIVEAHERKATGIRCRMAQILQGLESGTAYGTGKHQFIPKFDYHTLYNLNDSSVRYYLNRDSDDDGKKPKYPQTDAKNQVKRWTQDEDDQLIKEMFAHENLEQIAKDHGRNHFGIRCRMAYLQTTRGSSWLDGDSDEIADIYDLADSEVTAAIADQLEKYAEKQLKKSNKKNRWTDDEEQWLLDGIKAGKKFAELAKESTRTVAALKTRYIKLCKEAAIDDNDTVTSAASAASAAISCDNCPNCERYRRDCEFYQAQIANLTKTLAALSAAEDD